MRHVAFHHCTGRDRRGGFTAFEWVAAVTSIIVIVAFAVLSLSRARDGGLRTVCQNNLYQLSLAAMRQADHHGFYPGWRNDGPATGGFASWPIVLLPFLERNDLFKMIGQGNPAPAVFVSSFNCLASPSGGHTAPTLSYAGNCGSGSNLRRADGVMLDTTMTSGTTSGRLGPAELGRHDGLTHTLIFAEKCGPGTAAVPLGLSEWNDAIPVTTGTSIPGFSNGPNMYGVFGIAESTAAPAKIINSDTAAAPGFYSQPSSNHPGGAVVVFCDARTDFLNDRVDGRVYAQLLSWDDKACRRDARLYSTYNHWTFGYTTLKENDYR